MGSVNKGAYKALATPAAPPRAQPATSRSHPNSSQDGGGQSRGGGGQDSEELVRALLPHAVDADSARASYPNTSLTQCLLKPFGPPHPSNRFENRLGLKRSVSYTKNHKH